LKRNSECKSLISEGPSQHHIKQWGENALFGKRQFGITGAQKKQEAQDGPILLT